MNDSASASADKYADYSREQLLAEINRLKKNKKYGLVWEHKKEQVIEDFETQQPYLQEATEKRIENAPGEPTNLIIEGDNFEALSILNYTHAGKVDVIYIDPPYNTGNNDFIYNDDYVDSEDTFRHSKWLSFMEPRLKLAKILLKDNGVIFISIDENELSNLKNMCDIVFGEGNLLAIFNWKKTSTPPSLSKNVRRKYEYVLCYKSRGEIGGLCGGFVEGGDMPLLNGANAYGTLSFKKESVILKIKDGLYKRGKRDKIVLENDVVIKDGKLDNDIILSGNFKWKQNTLDEEIAQGTVFNIKSDKFAIRYQRSGERVKVPSNIISKDECMVGTNEDATKEIKDLFGGKDGVFSHPKPVSLIKYIISMIANNRSDAVIIDFFAGSGTTGQAVLELNKEDGGHRQFILCTNNGDKGPDSVKIAEDITYPRIKTVITGIRQDGSKYSDGIPANLRYYKIEHKEKKASIDANRLEIVRYLEDIIQVKENAFEQIEVNEDLALYKNSERFVGMVFEPFALEEIIESIKEKNSENKPVKLYVFSYSRDAFEDNYETDFEIEFVAMPEGLLKTYANIVAETKKEDA